MPHSTRSRLFVALSLALAVLAACLAASAGAAALHPTPEAADADRGLAFRNGCLVDQQSTATRRCVYGKRRSQVTVVLFGDSEAMQFFPPLLRIARSEGWRLVTRLRAGCTPAAITFSHRCDRWRDRTLGLIAGRDHPDLVVVTGGVAYRAVRRGRRLSSRRSARWLRQGYVRTLRRVRRTGARVAVIKDTPRSPRDVPDCVRRNADAYERCGFSRHQPTNRQFDRKAARRVKGATLLDPTPLLCPGAACPAVIGDVLVYRDNVHMTATFTAGLTGWLRARLPEPVR